MPRPNKVIPISKTYYEIIYNTPYSSGVICVDTNFYEKNIKKFQKLFKDCEITSFTERIKSKYAD